MYYIFNTVGACTSSCDFYPDVDDLVKRGEQVIESVEQFSISEIALVNGQIRKKELEKPIFEGAEVDPTVSDDLMDMAEIILDMSDTIRDLQKGGDTYDAV